MKLTEMFLQELDREAESTRRVLERVPEGKNHWKPHPKSMELGYLASLVASMPGWVEMMINTESLDFLPPGGEPVRTKVLETRRELIQSLDDGVAASREALARIDDEYLLTTNWKILVGGKVVQDTPRFWSIRDGVFQHLAHHRGQLTVYLRLNESLVPAIYGPSADERIADF